MGKDIRILLQILLPIQRICLVTLSIKQIMDCIIDKNVKYIQSKAFLLTMVTVTMAILEVIIMAIRISSMVSQTQSSFGIHTLILKGQFLMKFQTWQNFQSSFCFWYIGICRLDSLKFHQELAQKQSVFKRSFKERYNLDQIEQCLVFTTFLSDRYLGNPTNVCVKQSRKKIDPL